MAEANSTATTKARTKRWLVGVSIALATILALSILGAVFLARRPATVPDIRKQPIEEANRLLAAEKLSLGAVGEIATGSVGAGRVVTQRPMPGVEVPRRSSVEVTVAVGTKPLPLPDLLGQDADAAIQTLADALYLPARVDVFDATGEVGTVVGQFPPAGTIWVTGRHVAVAVSAGPSDGTAITVPDLLGQSATEAQASLKGAGLVGEGFLVNKTTPADNVVVSQLPQGGVLVNPGTTVLMLLSAR